DVTLESSAAREPDRPALLKELTRLEFHTLAKRLMDAEGPAEPLVLPTPEEAAAAPLAVPTKSAQQSCVIEEPGQLPGLVAALRSASIVALDTEASSLEPHDAELIGLTLAIAPDAAWYLPFGHRPRGGELAAPDPVTNLPPLTDPACAALAELLRDPA